MKGMILSLKKPNYDGIKGIKNFNFKEYFKQYGLLFFFILTVFGGIIWGSVVAKNADDNLVLSLDFLFTTNLSARLAQSAFETFCACFVSNFLFMLAMFLFGFAPWGVAVIPFVTMFKGFGVGLCAGYLYSSYGLKGIGFYMLILLLGIFVFCIALMVQGQNSFKLSLRIFKTIILEKEPLLYMKETIKNYLLYSGYMLIMATLAAIIDTVLWCAFAGLFNF